MFHTAETLVAKYSKKYPQPSLELQAGAATQSERVDPDYGGEPIEIQAAGVHGFSSAGKLQYVKASDHFLVGGEVIQQGEYVQLPEADARSLVAAGRAELATDDDVAAAQKASKK